MVYKYFDENSATSDDYQTLQPEPDEKLFLLIHTDKHFVVQKNSSKSKYPIETYEFDMTQSINQANNSDEPEDKKINYQVTRKDRDVILCRNVFDLNKQFVFGIKMKFSLDIFEKCNLTPTVFTNIIQEIPRQV
ncbi:hypothetical protein TRFO_35520 [Tritrichomonas foetus]|uniref:Uncharacterized protein n=1 Tax=Tritrichomonas foetus TaxID=1144522 RepID=A0A1J4JFV4_9EUKA|nr:hypothetical protein TRFO_35520 [Tritrichomonas foetus]|eukprot:OHS98102.1 hypothetical protein TRFO_35520 [Tritrichomonas foetus]